MFKRLSVVFLLAVAVATGAINYFDAADKFRSLYSTRDIGGQPAAAVIAHTLHESPATNGKIPVFDADTQTYRDISYKELPGESFVYTATLTSAAAATAVTIIPDASVYAGRKVYIAGYTATVNGATDWATTATITIQDTNSSPVVFTTLTASTLDGNEVHGPFSDSAAQGNAMKLGTGGTAAKGIVVIGNANGTGSDLVVTIYGVIR